MSESAVDRVVDRESFAAYADALRVELEAGAEWENSTLERFLDALAAFARDATLPDPPTWRTLAELLRAGAYYE